MFETFYPKPERDHQPDTADRYQEIPLGVEAAWPTAESEPGEPPASD